MAGIWRLESVFGDSIWSFDGLAPLKPLIVSNSELADSVPPSFLAVSGLVVSSSFLEDLSFLRTIGGLLLFFLI